jgi:hypothetical protein
MTEVPNAKIGIIPYTTPATFLPHGFHIYDHDPIIIGTGASMATVTDPEGVASTVSQRHTVPQPVPPRTHRHRLSPSTMSDRYCNSPDAQNFRAKEYFQASSRT